MTYQCMNIEAEKKERLRGTGGWFMQLVDDGKVHTQGTVGKLANRQQIERWRIEPREEIRRTLESPCDMTVTFRWSWLDNSQL